MLRPALGQIEWATLICQRVSLWHRKNAPVPESWQSPCAAVAYAKQSGQRDLECSQVFQDEVKISTHRPPGPAA